MYAKKSSVVTEFTVIGIKPWNVPHSSEHCPKKVPILSMFKNVELSLPGIQSNFRPKDGTAQLCNTSEAVTTTLILVSYGRTREESTESNLSSPSDKTSSGLINESKLAAEISLTLSMKGVISYDQYH